MTVLVNFIFLETIDFICSNKIIKHVYIFTYNLRAAVNNNKKKFKKKHYNYSGDDDQRLISFTQYDASEERGRLSLYKMESRPNV